MSSNKKSASTSAVESVEVAPKFSLVPERIEDLDKMSLELAKSRRQTALAQAEKALAQNETAEISYQYVVLQVYNKYSLNFNDIINEKYEIVRGGALQEKK